MKKSEVRQLKPGTLLIASWSGDENTVLSKFIHALHGGDVAHVESASNPEIRTDVYRKHITLAAPQEPADPHAELRAQYAEDATWHPRPWELWEFSWGVDWLPFDGCHPSWHADYKYRRKPLLINGIDVPWPVRDAAKLTGWFYVADPAQPEFYLTIFNGWDGSNLCMEWLKRGLIYLTADAAATHGRALASFTEVLK